MSPSDENVDNLSVSGDVSSPLCSLQPDCVHSGDRAMLSTIDDVIFENDAFWDEKIKKELKDVHPSILCEGIYGSSQGWSQASGTRGLPQSST